MRAPPHLPSDDPTHALWFPKAKEPLHPERKVKRSFHFFPSKFQPFGRRYKFSILLNILIFFEFSSF